MKRIGDVTYKKRLEHALKSPHGTGLPTREEQF